MSSDVTPEPSEAIASDVLAVPGVHDLHAGVMGEVATYLPGRRVNGIRVKGDSCEVHVVLDYGVSVLEVADHVRKAVERHVAGPVHVTVEDVAEAPTSS